MNCKEVEIVITDLARDGLIEVEVRERALGHLKVCEPCGERLAEEKRLSEGLRVWAQASRGEQAPPEVEARLRVAFRERLAGRSRRRWIAAAAVGSVAAGVLVLKLIGGAAPVSMPPAPPPAAVVAGRFEAGPVEVGPPPARPGIGKKRAKRPPHIEPVEVGTEFFPVAQDDGWTPLEGGRLVRVELPKSALGVFGLPVDEERGPERVRADVMVSHDGLLRAIRFVH